MNDEEYKARPIPTNYENGVNIGGLNFQGIYLIEGIVLFVIFAAIPFFILWNLGITDVGSILGICMVFGGIASFAGFKGINDEPITTFLFHMFKFFKNRRIAYYNPRIKLEAIPYLDEKNDVSKMIPRERILAAFEKIKENYNKRQQERIKKENDNINDRTILFFEDDEGVIKQPKAYLSDDEYAEYERKINKIRSITRKGERR